MKKSILCIFTAVMFFSCDQTPKTDNSHESKSGNRHGKLLSKFIDISFDTLQVYSPEYSSHKDSSDIFVGKFVGIQLDSTDAMLFPNGDEATFQYSNGHSDLYAIYKFPIDSNTLGLITRTPSEYVSSSIKLFYFDKIKDSITSYIELAEVWGDAGDFMTKDSWIFKDSNQNLQAFTWVMNSYLDYEKEKEKHKESNDYYLLDISKPKTDTIIKSAKTLAKQFRNIKASR